MVSNQANSASRTGGRRYRHLFNYAPICIVVIDLSVTPAAILELNRRAELVYGYPAAELVGLPADRLVADEARPAALSIVQQVQQGETVTAETINRRRDGTRFPGRVIAATDPADNGQMIVTVEDITAERQRRTEAEAIASERLRIAQALNLSVYTVANRLRTLYAKLQVANRT